MLWLQQSDKKIKHFYIKAERVLTCFLPEGILPTLVFTICHIWQKLSFQYSLIDIIDCVHCICLGCLVCVSVMKMLWMATRDSSPFNLLYFERQFAFTAEGP